MIPVIDHVHGRRQAALRFWGMNLANGKFVINARSETMAEKRTFAPLLSHHRCLVPASGWFEWDRSEGRPIPYYFTRPDLPVMTLAALWRPAGNGQEELVMLTEKAHPGIAHVHHRMPVVLEPERAETWLSSDPLTSLPGRLAEVEPPVGWVVSCEVNKVANDSPRNIEEVKPPPTQLSLFD
jgi:putative SOS response-associated peptidase YedK